MLEGSPQEVHIILNLVEATREARSFQFRPPSRPILNETQIFSTFDDIFDVRKTHPLNRTQKLELRIRLWFDIRFR